MAFEIVDGATGTKHISSEDLACLNESALGAKDCVFEYGDKFALTVVDNNKVTIGTGSGMIGARRFWNKAPVDLTISSGTQGRSRNDLVVARYAITDDGIESVNVVVIEGEPTTGTPADPATTANDLPLWRVPVSGITIGTPESLRTYYALPIANGGTGAKTAAAARTSLGVAAASHNHAADNITSGTLPVGRGGTGVTSSAAIGLKAYPVGAVYISYVSTSPASLFGGTWTAITGRFPYFNAGTGTGGSNTHTLTVAQMPSSYASLDFRTMGGNSIVPSVSGGSKSNIGSDYTYVGTGGSTSSLERITLSGSNSGHNNMPAYQTLYAWRRTA